MSAAATAAGYLYASGRLRGRGAKEQEHHEPEQKPQHPRREVKVAVYQREEKAQDKAPEKPKRVPKIEYRTRRAWKPE